MNRRIVPIIGNDRSPTSGMLALPEPGAAATGMACILISPGVKSRVAPHGLYRKLEGEFLANGLPVLRLDCRGFGDSLTEDQATEELNRSYDATQEGAHVIDVLDAMSCLERELGVRQFILGGLCGGALTALYVAARDARVAGVYSVGMPVAPNEIVGGTETAPLTTGEFQAERRNLLRKLARLRAWTRFLTLRSDYRLHRRVLSEQLTRNFGAMFGRQEKVALPPPETDQQPDLHPAFASAFFGAAVAGVRMLLLFGANDRMYWNFQGRFAERRAERIGRFGAQIQVRVIPDANHVLSEPDWTAQARRHSAAWLKSLAGHASSAAQAGALTTEVIADSSAFGLLQKEWNELLADSPANSVTLTWEWLHTWWQVYSEDRRLLIVLVRESGRLIGAAPLLLRERVYWHNSLVPTRRIELLASGEDVSDAVCSDYIGWIFRGGRHGEVANAVLNALESEPGLQWDEIILRDFPAESPILGELRDACRLKGLYFEELAREQCLYIPLPQSLDHYLQTVSSGHRYKIRRALREFAALGGSYELLADPADVPAALESLIDLHQKRWTAKGKDGAFASAKRTEFHRRLIPIALQRGWLRLGTLRVAGKAVGSIYNFVYAGRETFYQSGIEPQESSGMRPGMLLHALEIQAATAGGVAEYDFLKRGPSNYKQDWTQQTRDLVAVRIARNDLRNRCVLALRSGRKALAHVRNQLRADPVQA